jgi:hypothetical protein
MDVTLLHYQSFHNNQKITKKKIFLSSPDQKAKRVDITWMQSIEERNQCFCQLWGFYQLKADAVVLILPVPIIPW